MAVGVVDVGEDGAGKRVALVGVSVVAVWMWGLRLLLLLGGLHGGYGASGIGR